MSNCFMSPSSFLLINETNNSSSSISNDDNSQISSSSSSHHGQIDGGSTRSRHRHSNKNYKSIKPIFSIVSLNGVLGPFWFSLVFLFVCCSNQIHAFDHSSSTIQKVESSHNQELNTVNNNNNNEIITSQDISRISAAKYRSIILYAFERTFKLNLKLIPSNEFLSGRTTNNGEYSNACFYRGIVDDDVQSIAYINLCHMGHVIGSFDVNNTEYFIEPIEEFDASTYEKNEFSFVDFGFDVDLSLKTHLLLKTKAAESAVASSSKQPVVVSSTSSSSSCGLDDDNDDNINKNATTTTTTSKRHRSKRRAASLSSSPSSPVVDRRLYLELLVVVDRKMYEYYDSNLENHILTLMFMVTQMYQHSSLINPIRVYITDIVYLHKLEERKYRPSFETEWEAEKTLNKFCEWQHEYKREANLKDKVDATILITKTDICKSKNVCQTLGMARLNQICVSGQSCAVIEDSGINTAYTIAHEIGHLLGMKHVDEDRCHGIDNKTTQMMASMLDLTKKSHAWSNCSVEDLNAFLRTGDAECLFNVPEKNPNFINRTLSFDDTNEQFDERTILNALYPGSLQAYEIKHQCQQIFGPRSDACEQHLDDDCKILWCKSYETYSPEVAVHCVTTNTKWADGTPCGLSEYNTVPKICMNGECVSKSDDRALKEDGQWGSWSEFTPCSRSCGGGVRKRYRSCDNPKPKNGGKYCVGDRYHYESCNTQDCKLDESAFRDEQCRMAVQEISPQKMRDQMGFVTNNTFLWKAYYSHDPRRKCILFCKLEDRPNFAMLRPMVLDGTKCGLNTFDICVNGHCLPGGCDNVLYSNKQNDNCGVCAGGNKSCRETTYTLETPNHFGYNKLSVIPPKSTNIFIHRQRDGDDLGCLVIRSASSFLLNGHYVISKTSTSIKFDGKFIDYIVNDTDEIIKSPGNFSQQLEIQFLAGSKKIYNNIKFTYYTPIVVVVRRPSSEQYRQAKSNSRGDEIASMETSSSVATVRKTALMRQQQQDEDRIEGVRGVNNNNNYKMPELFEKNITRVGQCDKLCNGVQIVYLNRCKKSGDHECKPMQPETRSCNTECDLRVLASQGRCTPNVGDCGAGKLDVKVECIKIDKQSNLTRQVDLFHCDSNEVRSVYELYKNSQCYLPCDNFDWKLADSVCSCENGFKKQVYQCHDRLTNEVVNESKCQNRAKPKQDRVKCDVYCYKWRSGYWSECSKSCGTGVRYRTKYCIFNATQIVDSSYCKSSSSSSADQQQVEKSMNTIEYEYCNTDECPHWSTSSWSVCSSTSCGQTGKRQRRVTCMFKSSEVDTSKCVMNSGAPTGIEDCVLECDGVWRTGEWSECSVTCERGHRTRAVYCERKPGDTTTTNTAMCEPKTRPTNVTECQVDEKCPKWIISSWSSCKGQCSGSGGVQHGFRTRTVLCSAGTNTACEHLPKPLNYENCSLNCAPHSRQWRAEEWSECNGDCNFGWKFRKVNCVDENNNTVSANECSMRDQPERRQRCMSCNGVWKAGQWGKCSNPCGKGVQTRVVECRAAFTNELLTASRCNPNAKLVDQRSCEDLSCSKEELTFDWQIVSKGDCSVTCGLGWRLRRFECKNSRNNESVSTSKCRSETQPTYYEQCNAGECPHWQHGGWSVCSSECGEGMRRRLVVCLAANGLVSEDSACSAATRPHDYEKCVARASCARWTSGSWSDCDFRTCTKVRSVVCAHENGTRAHSDNECSKSDKPNYIAECDSRISCKHYQATFQAAATVGGSNTNSNTNANNDQPITSALPLGFIHYTQWSSCSSKCGTGWRTRRALCKSVANDSVELDMRYCGKEGREQLRMECNVAQCYYRVVEIWSQCSSSCGQQGLETLERRCFETVTKNFTDLSNCGLHANTTKPVTRTCYRPCVRHVRHAFEWRATDWKPCSAKCGFGYKNRTIYCWNQQENKKANESYCVAKNKPASTLPCMNVTCGFGWFVSEWSTCSKNCSTGFKSREVICAKISKEGHILNVTSNRCNMAEKPAHRITCNYGDCGGSYFWKPGKWSKCQPSCGFGYQKRTMSCVDRAGNMQKDVSLCRKSSMPVTSQFCFTNCHMASCSKLRSLFGVTKDGDYDLRVSDKVVSIYCKYMNTTKPKEYITLKSGESQNFAEIYDKKLLEPSKCRIGPKYGGYCSFCKNETLETHGIILFSKVRFDIKTLTVIDDDFSFSNVIYGNPVPYGHSGDCYSSLPECQHARFNINFKGTGFVIDNSVKWINYGEKPHSKIVYAKDHSSVYGTCGGLCGFCRPDPQTGLKLRVV